MPNERNDKRFPKMQSHQAPKQGSSRSHGDEGDELSSASIVGQKRDVSQLDVNPPLSSEFHEKGTSKRQPKTKTKNEETMKPPPVASAVSNNEDAPSNMSLHIGNADADADAEALPAAAATKSNTNLEHSRAMSRIYSQRNRDKQKRQIQDLAEAKIHLDRENTSLRIINQDYMTRLGNARAENDALRLSSQIAAATGTTAPQLPSPMIFASNRPPQHLPQEALLMTTAPPHKDSLLNLAATLVQQPMHQSLPSPQSQELQPQQRSSIPRVLLHSRNRGVVPLHQEITALDSRVTHNLQERLQSGIPGKKASDLVQGSNDEKSASSTVPASLHVPQMINRVDRSQSLDTANQGGRLRGDQQNEDETGREDLSS